MPVARMAKLDRQLNPERNRIEMKHIDVGYAKIFHRTLGSGPDILFIHGWPLHSDTFREIVPALAESYTCHLIDLPGAGKSEWEADTPISLLDHCETVQRVVDKLGLEKFAIVAHDSGGIFARHLAANNPENVQALVLGNTDIPTFHSKLLSLFISLLSMPGMSTIFPALLRLKSFRNSKYFGRALVYNMDLLEGEFGRLFVKPLMEDKKVMKGQLKLIKAWDWSVVQGLTQVHKKIEAPVQLIWGKDDGVFPLRPARPMVEEFSGPVDLEVIDHARLFVHEDQPEEFATLARRFLDREFGAVG